MCSGEHVCLAFFCAPGTADHARVPGVHWPTGSRAIPARETTLPVPSLRPIVPETTLPGRMGRRRLSRPVHLGLIACVVASGFAMGCAPSVAPLYRDYKSEAAPDSVNIAIYDGLAAAGWSLADSDIDNVVVTEPRVIRRWGLYHIEVSLEVSRLSGGFVRVFVNPYRVYFTGRRSKTPYLKGSHARSILPPLREAFAARNIHVVGERRPPTDRVAGR